MWLLTEVEWIVKLALSPMHLSRAMPQRFVFQASCILSGNTMRRIRPPSPPAHFSISWPKNILLVCSPSRASCISVTARSLISFRILLYIAMQFFRSVNTRLLFLFLSTTVNSNTLLGHLLDIDSPANILEARQEPGVVATPDFLRRGFHSCKY